MYDRKLTSAIVVGITLAFSIGVDAQMHVDSLGKIGIGTVSPVGDLHVKGTDPQVIVEANNPAIEPRSMLVLKNNGNTKFSILNTQANVEWAFANPGTSFRVSRQNSGIIEFEVFNNGNMAIAGNLIQNSDVNAKTAITQIDTNDILNTIARLPVQRWEYKDARGEPHIGPMAQDFYAAFGLGGTATGISTIDTAGVALAAIKALAEKNAIMEAKNQSLQAAIEQLQSDNQALLASQSQLLSNQQTQLANYTELKMMLIDLQMQSQSKNFLTHADY